MGTNFMTAPKWHPPGCDIDGNDAVWKSSGDWTDPDNGFVSHCTLYACENGHGGTDMCVPQIAEGYTNVERWVWIGPSEEKRLLQCGRNNSLGDLDMATDARPEEIVALLNEPAEEWARLCEVMQARAG